MSGGPGGPTGPLFAMPIIVSCMGGEMVYILEQRLYAQNVGPEKSKKVLQDVLRTMYSPKVRSRLSVVPSPHPPLAPSVC